MLSRRYFAPSKPTGGGKGFNLWWLIVGIVVVIVVVIAVRAGWFR
jgi:hypothetical protein